METQTAATLEQPARAVRSKMLGILGLLLIFLLVFVYRLDVRPATWHDEAQFLHVAKNYAENGVYADYSSEGNRYMGPVISLGPTVMLPVALLYKVFGVSILTSRLVMSLYALLMLAALYGVTSTIGDQRQGLLALIVAVFSYTLNLPHYSRNVSGEVPALFFTFAALWLWLRDGKRHPATLAGVGVLFGLACITKNMFALFICPALLIAWLLELVWYRQRGSLYFIIPGVMTGVVLLGWTVYILYLHDAAMRDVSADLEAMRAASSSAFFLLDPRQLEENLLFLSDGGVFSGFILPVVLFGVYLSHKRDEAGQRWGILNLFFLLSLAIFVTSIGWRRFAVPSLALAIPVFVRLIHDLTNGLRPDLPRLLERLRHSPTSADLAALMGIMLLLGTITLPVLREVVQAVRGIDDDPYRMADYVNANIPADALIETWEEELAVLTDHTVHFPPQIVEAYNVEYLYQGGPPTSGRYDFRDYVDPDYVIVGYFGKWSELYPPEHLTDYKLIHSIGDYDIYQRTVDPDTG